MKKVLQKVPTLSSSLLLLVVILTSFSCKNSTIPKLEYSNQETIKEEVKDLETQTSWTNEIEKEILENPLITDPKFLIANTNPTPDLLKLNKNNNMPVYPEMENFGSLDIRNLKQSLKETVDNFSKSLSSNIYSGPETFFDEKYRFNYIFFKNDFISQWKKYFNQDFPYTEKNDKEIELFTNWIIGQPFIGPDVTSLPLRFYCQEGTIDVTLYISNKSKNMIYQITIDRWGKKV